MFKLCEWDDLRPQNYFSLVGTLKHAEISQLFAGYNFLGREETFLSYKCGPCGLSRNNFCNQNIN